MLIYRCTAKWSQYIYVHIHTHIIYTHICMPAQLLRSCPTLPPDGPLPARLLCPWDFPGKNMGVGCHALLQEIFLTHWLNLHLLHCRWILYHWAVGTHIYAEIYIYIYISSVQFSHSVMWKASLSITHYWSLFKLISIMSVMPSNHLILCRPLLLPPSIFPWSYMYINTLGLLS